MQITARAKTLSIWRTFKDIQTSIFSDPCSVICIGILALSGDPYIQQMVFQANYVSKVRKNTFEKFVQVCFTKVRSSTLIGYK
jgi:hypothetical protein